MLGPNSLAITFSIEYQILIISAFTPFLHEETDYGPSPKEIVVDSIKKVRTIVHLWYLRHGFEETNAYLINAVTYLSFVCMESITEHMSASDLEDIRSTLFLAAKGLYAQGNIYYIAKTLFEVIRQKMRKEEAQCLKSIMDIKAMEIAERHTHMAEVQSQWLKAHWHIDLPERHLSKDK